MREEMKLNFAYFPFDFDYYLLSVRCSFCLLFVVTTGVRTNAIHICECDVFYANWIKTTAT